MEIKKVKLYPTKNGNGLVLTTTEIDGAGAEIDNPAATHKGIIHKDLQDAIANLAIHFAIMSGYINSVQVEDIALPDPKLTEKFHVKGYSIGGNEETAGVIISGNLILKNGLAHNFNTPFYRFELAPESRYVFMDDLQARIARIENEIALYLDGKRGQAKEPELPFETGKASPEAKLASSKDQYKYADKDAMARVAEMDEKPKKGNRKKVAQSAEAPSGEVVE